MRPGTNFSLRENMGCSAGVQQNTTVTDIIQKPSLGEDMDSSYDTWKWTHLPPGHPGQPNRKLHEKHLKKLNTFLQRVDSKPWVFHEYVERQRGSEEKDVEIRISL